MTKFWKYSQNDSGVTLVELMTAVAISGFVISAIYMTFKAQQRTSFIQDEVASMQQNTRAGISLMTSEIRMAGYDPLGSSGAGIQSANATAIHFTMDLDDNGTIDGSDEDITYNLYSAEANTIPTLGRKAPINNSAVAEYIEYLEFRYLDSDNNTLASPVTTPANIGSVVVSILARSRTADSDFTNTNNYPKLSGGNIDLTNDTINTPANPLNYRRRQLVTTIKFRNMGL